MLPPQRRLLRWIKWSCLNVGLPFFAAALTFILAYLTDNGETHVERSFIRAFGSGDILLVSAIMFVALYYEADELRAADVEGWHIVHEVVRILMFSGCILAATLFGSFKFFSFLPDVSPPAIKDSMAYAGATLSVAMLFAACVFSLIGRAALIVLVSTQSE
jgi:hypothetical protein